MTYNLKFLPTALKEWQKLDKSIQVQFKKKLTERLENPYVPASKLWGFDSVYKIKLRAAGFRLVYEVDEDIITVLVIAVGRRDGNDVYEKAKTRLS